MNSKRKRSIIKEPSVVDPRQNKTLVYVALGLTIAGAILALVPTILIISPLYNLSWQTIYLDPLFYIFLGGIVLTTVGFVMHRKVTPPMDINEQEKLRSRLE
ncbi:MAG: hypothetical protein ACTSO7_05525 [Candidatus Heimdallarchaeota archaeon]